jgi:hypothetical protein
VKSLAIWTPVGSRSTVRQRNAKSERNIRADATGAAVAMRPDEALEKCGLVLVTAELMGDPKPDHVRAELRQDEGGSASAGQDECMEVARPRWRSPATIAATQLAGPAKGERAPPVPAPNEIGKCAWW